MTTESNTTTAAPKAADPKAADPKAAETKSTESKSAATKTAKTAKATSNKKSAKASAQKTSGASKSAKNSGGNKVAADATKLAQDATEQAKKAFAQANDQMESTMEQVADRVEAVMTDVVKFSKRAGFTTVGVPFALQSKYEAGTLADFETYKSFLDDARYAGEQQFGEFQKTVEPYVKQVADRIEPVVAKWEDSLPEPARKTVKQNRERAERVANA